ncbi:hypothetical protein ACEXQD_07240 [Herbiconiux sp. P15]|uniref:hypothetical protein n=1 Tax=Herbiconiux liukaitaii TaxID=3342799 RepID=UPI0035BA7171
MEGVAAVVEQLGVLVSAGVAPGQAWGYVAEVSDDDLVRRVAAEAIRGVPVADAILRSLGASPGGHQVAADSSGLKRRKGSLRARRDADADAAWRSLAAAWSVATEAGAPMRRCLIDIAGSLHAMGGVEREAAAALAGPAATARLVMVLPIVSMFSGSLMGLDTVGALLGTPAGLLCLGAGLLLMLLGRLWTTRLLRRARGPAAAPGLSLDLMAVAIGGGGSLAAARALVHTTTERFDLRPRSAPDPDDPAITAVLTLSARSGAPPALLLRSEAARLRRDAVGAARERASALGVWLMLPLGLCALPAFILLAVAPVLLSVLTPGLLP